MNYFRIVFCFSFFFFCTSCASTPPKKPVRPTLTPAVKKAVPAKPPSPVAVLPKKQPAESPAALPKQVSPDVNADISNIPLPTYISILPNINDYNIFANSGWDGNWYVGYNICWIVNLPINMDKPEIEKYRKALIGAKLGRSKSQSVTGKSSWEKEPVQGSIYVATSPEPAWPSETRFFLTSTLNIPLEGDQNDAIRGTGESRWFWVEIPLENLNFNGANYIALWSDTENLTSRQSAPILCGGWDNKPGEKRTWVNNDIQGTPPIELKDSLKTALSVFQPAIIIKLIPGKSEQTIKINIDDITASGELQVVTSQVTGSQIERAWLEVLDQQNKYIKTGSYLYNPPYMFSLNTKGALADKMVIRVAAEDIWSNTAYSPPTEIKK